MTDAELTILSLLAQGSRFGHEIQRIIDERGLRDWLAIGFSSVYYILNKFERQKMVISELRGEGDVTARKLYTLTEAGRGILQTAVSDLLRTPRSVGSGFELGLANLYVLRPAQTYQMLTHHREDLSNQLKSVNELWERYRANDNIEERHDITALYTHSISRMEADLEWLSKFLDDWRNHYPGVEKEGLKSLTQTPIDDRRIDTKLHDHTPPDALKMLQQLQPLSPIPPDAEEKKDEG